MSEAWRIFVVEGDENLQQHIVNALRKDGYIVQGALNGADAVRVLWSQAYDIVISDLHTPGASGFDLLQWLRAYRPNTDMILIGETPAAQVRIQALESGAIAYLEKPLDVRQLKEELRRHLQQTGFSADLDSFDLLDVIQMITMSRRSIALLVNTGLEERGMLRFHSGELIWAEYGMLRGEEAFFALAAHKNGSVVQQPWNGGGMTNVTQPLSRLIFQALQYRTKYANVQDDAEELGSGVTAAFDLDEIDDSPFVVAPEALDEPAVAAQEDGMQQDEEEEVHTEGKEWWENTGSYLDVRRDGKERSLPAPEDEPAAGVTVDKRAITNPRLEPLPPTVHPPVSSEPGLPSWLTGQPTASRQSAVRPTAFPPTRNVPNTPTIVPPSPEWQLPLSDAQVSNHMASTQQRVVPDGPSSSSPEWSPVGDQLSPPVRPTTDEVFPGTAGHASLDDQSLRQAPRRGYNYQAMVSALQTLGYSIPGFIAAAVVGMDGQPIAQVAVDEVDIAQVCKPLTGALQGFAQVLEQEQWGDCEQVVVSSSTRHIFIRIIGDERKAFQVLIAGAQANTEQCQKVMANVEGTIEAALTR